MPPPMLRSTVPVLRTTKRVSRGNTPPSKSTNWMLERSDCAPGASRRPSRKTGIGSMPAFDLIYRVPNFWPGDTGSKRIRIDVLSVTPAGTISGEATLGTGRAREKPSSFRVISTPVITRSTPPVLVIRTAESPGALPQNRVSNCTESVSATEASGMPRPISSVRPLPQPAGRP